MYMFAHLIYFIHSIELTLFISKASQKTYILIRLAFKNNDKISTIIQCFYYFVESFNSIQLNINLL